MKRLLLVLMGLAASCLFTGCVEPEPAYRAELLAFDPGVIGTWQSERSPEGEYIQLLIEGRTVESQDGRLSLEAIKKEGDAAADAAPVAPPNACRVTVSMERPGKKTDPNAPNVLTFDPMVFQGLMLNIGGTRFLTLQANWGYLLSPRFALGFGIRTHQALRIERRDDQLMLRMPKQQFYWSPDVVALDSAKVSGEPDLGDPEHPRPRLTLDLDRFVEVCRKYGPREDFWEAPMAFSRAIAVP